MKSKILFIVLVSLVLNACANSQVKPMSDEEKAEWRRERMMFHHVGRLGM